MLMKKMMSHRNTMMKTAVKLDLHLDQKQMTSLITSIKVHYGIGTVVWAIYLRMDSKI